MSGPLRLSVAIACLATAVIAQEAPTAAPDHADVLAVLDSSPLDVHGFEALLRRGAAATPSLLTALASSPADEATRARRQERVLRALRVLGPDAASAGPRLVQLLAEADPKDVPALLDTLSATAALGPEPGKLLDAATAAWTPFVKPGDQGFIDRLKGAIRLHMRLTQPLPTTDSKALIEALESGDPYIRELGAELLGRLGNDARSALGALENAGESLAHPRQARLPNHSLGTDFNRTIQSAAWIAIARIAPNDPRAVNGMCLLLKSDDPRERIEAAMALGRLGDRVAEGRLLDALTDEDPRLVAEVLTALGMIGAESPRAVGAIRKLADHEDRAVRARARATLLVLGVALPENRKG